MGAIAACLLLFGTVVPASAYVDPNGASLLFQILAPVLAAVASVWLLAKEKFVILMKMLFGGLGRRLQK